MKIKTLEKFHDLKVGVIREEGEIFEDTEVRFKEINKLSKEIYGKIFVEKVEETTTEEVDTEETTTEETTKKRTGKKRS